MAFENPFGGYRIEQPGLGISRTTDRYGATPWSSGLAGTRMGSPYGAQVGLGAGTQHQNTELPGQASRVSQQAAALKGLLDQVQSAISQHGPVLSTDVSGVGILGNAQAAASAIQGAIDQLQGVLPQVSQNYGSFAGSTDAFNAADSVLQATSGVLSQNRGIPGTLAAAAGKVQQAQADANRASTAARTAAQNTVATALLQAQSLAGSGNFDGATAALQAPNVVAAAQAVGRDGDVQSALAAITGQKALAANQAAAQQQVQQCSQNGGQWTGTSCDMSAANAMARQIAQAKAQCAANGGTWDDVGQFCNMAAKVAADRQAQIDEQARLRQAQIDAQNLQLQQQAQIQQAQLAQQQAQFEAQQAAAQQQAQLAQQNQQQQAMAQAAQACIQRGGSWDGQACDLSSVMAQQQQDRQSSQIMSLLPFLAGNPQLLAQAVAKILGLDPGSLAGGVPGGSQGGAVQVSAVRGPYADQGYGAESF